jgi:hypothetical protein
MGWKKIEKSTRKKIINTSRDQKKIFTCYYGRDKSGIRQRGRGKRYFLFYFKNKLNFNHPLGLNQRVSKGNQPFPPYRLEICIFFPLDFIYFSNTNNILLSSIELNLYIFFSRILAHSPVHSDFLVRCCNYKCQILYFIIYLFIYLFFSMHSLLYIIYF